jgi:hypothetical protein
MAGSADEYRLKAADMLAKAEQHELFRAEFENLAKAFLRLADQADRNAQLGWLMEPDDRAAHQKQEPSEAQPQQQQQVQPKDESKSD